MVDGEGVPVAEAADVEVSTDTSRVVTTVADGEAAVVETFSVVPVAAQP